MQAITKWNDYRKHRREYRVRKTLDLYAVQRREAGPFFSRWVTKHVTKTTEPASKLMDILADRDESNGICVIRRQEVEQIL